MPENEETPQNLSEWIATPFVDLESVVTVFKEYSALIPDPRKGLVASLQAVIEGDQSGVLKYQMEYQMEYRLKDVFDLVEEFDFAEEKEQGIFHTPFKSGKALQNFFRLLAVYPSPSDFYEHLIKIRDDQNALSLSTVVRSNLLDAIIENQAGDRFMNDWEQIIREGETEDGLLFGESKDG